MSDEHKEIIITGVDKDSIVMGSSKLNLWVVPFKLSSKPDQDWERKFYEVQQRDKNVMKRKVQILGDFIKVEVTETDDLQKVLDVIRLEVTETNALCEGDYQKKMKMRRELEELQHKQGDITAKFKGDSDKLKF